MLKVLLVVILFAVATYGIVRIIDRRGVAPVVRRPERRKTESRPQGPDDDEAFLRDLDRRRRHPGDPDSPS